MSPSTPPAAAVTERSTSYSRGTGSSIDYDTDTRVDQYYPYLTHDISPTPEIEFHEFLRLVWDVNLNQYDKRAKEISKEQKFQDLLKEYGQPVSCEEDHYPPFVNLANYVLSLNTGPQMIFFVRNDPSVLWGSRAKSKPDVLVVSRETLEEHGGDSDSFSKNGPDEESAFHWGEILDFWEFKLEVKEGPDECRKWPVSSKCLG